MDQYNTTALINIFDKKKDYCLNSHQRNLSIYKQIIVNILFIENNNNMNLIISQMVKLKI